ncbi:hypothetical protein [Pseudomonas synxantha]|uniref:Delta-60 repeat protein n=1 Tax=Pseudomonas synxantha TaxID=47883 RepID=A0ACC6JFS8_9PSED|nr:hypothetical protein [Pseudomonas synxantha]MDR6605084.1 putative delta-60 repeat protein [Pseudomonas synxantha]
MSTNNEKKNPGDSDDSFGKSEKGKISLSNLPHINGTDRLVKGLYTLDSGKFIVGASVSHDDNTSKTSPKYLKMYYGLTRLDKNGSIDKEFAKKGLTFGQFKPPFNAWGGKVVVHKQSIYMLGFTALDANSDYPPTHLTLSRFTEKGALDKGFADNGHLILRNQQQENLIGNSTHLAIQPDDKIVISATYHAMGNHTQFSGVLYRITPEGQLDQSFNKTGRLDVRLNNKTDITSVNAMQLHEDKILIAGDVTQTDGVKGYFARYDVNGDEDKTFGDPVTPGVYVLNIKDSTVQALIQTEKKSFFGLGMGKRSGKPEGLLAGMNANGRPNLQFNRGLPVLTVFDEEYGESWQAGFIDAEGRITVAGITNRLHFARFLSDGQVDKKFGEMGYTEEDTNANVTPVFLQQKKEDRRFVFGGNTLGLGGSLGVLWAYLS